MRNIKAQARRELICKKLKILNIQIWTIKSWMMRMQLIDYSKEQCQSINKQGGCKLH